MQQLTITLAIGLIALRVFTGCARDRAPDGPRASFESMSQLPALQVAKVDPTLKGQRYSVLLNFELASDDAFVTADGGKVSLDGSKAITGRASLRVAGGTRGASVKISSLLVGRPFPANWTLLGSSIFAEKQCAITAKLELADGSTVSQTAALRPGEWNSVWLDISKLPAGASPVRLQYEFDGRSTLWLDDVLLTDNDYFYIGQSERDEPWSIHRRGFGVTVQAPGKFRAALDTVLAKPGGFIVDETSPLRARFSSNGDVKELTIYRDGRSYWDGDFRALSPQARSEGGDQHTSPAQVSVPEAMGRVDRRSPGDVNNDGYNERVGAYQVIATTPRIDVILAPRSTPLLRPVVEVAGLPAGNVLVTVEGRLVESFVRTPAGTLLIELPFRIDRIATVNVRVN